jgi:hypothetical protein
MPNLNSIVSIINTSLATTQFSSRSFQAGKYYTISDEVKTASADNDNKIEPMMVENNGECTKLVYDDKFSMIIFHTLDEVSYEIAKPNFGEPGTFVREIANMQLVFAGSSKRLNVRREEIAAAIAIGMPYQLSQAQLTPLNLNYGIIEPGDVELDPYKNWSSLWQGMKSFVKPETILIVQKYKIVTEYGKSCWSLCPSPNGIYNY